MTDTDRLMEALKILDITVAATDVSGELAWFRDGEYLGTYGIKDGLRTLRTITSFVKAERDGE